MSKTLGYYGIDTSNSLVQDIIETFGSALQNISEVDTLHLLRNLSDEYIIFVCPEEDEISDEAYEAFNRLYELKKDELIRLIQALVNKPLGKPIGYWMLSNENSLIEDITDTWGQSLETISEFDRFWLIARCASHIWQQYSEEPPSEEAQEAAERIEELLAEDTIGLIKALADD
jgi:hypothetical protein